MAVKRSLSGGRILAVLEAIAGHQPIGVSALARLLDEDKSAIQRALMTLADEAWIHCSRELPVRWEVGARLLAIAGAAQGSSDLRRRVRPHLEQLRNDTGETLLLVVPDRHDFVVVDIAESRQVLRMVPQLGVRVVARNTASGRAMLPYLDTARQTALLGAQAEPALRQQFEAVRRLGYAVSDGEINPSATSIAAAILEPDGFASGALVLIAPKQRLSAARQAEIGRLIQRAARELSRDMPR